MAAGSTYTPIASYTVTSNQATITFSSIPSTYTDLHIVCSLKNSDVATNLDGFVRFNSDSGSNYSANALYGNGTTGISGRSSNDTWMMWPIDSNTYFTLFNFDINNYASTSTYKTMLMRTGQTDYMTALYLYLWRNTAAINTISFTSSDIIGVTDYFVAGSNITLYGITAA